MFSEKCGADTGPANASMAPQTFSPGPGRYSRIPQIFHIYPVAVCLHRCPETLMLISSQLFFLRQIIRQQLFQTVISLQYVEHFPIQHIKTGIRPRLIYRLILLYLPDQAHSINIQRLVAPCRSSPALCDDRSYGLHQYQKGSLRTPQGMYPPRYTPESAPHAAR